jgi:hypothetical protein
MLPDRRPPTTITSPAITRDQISAWKHYFEGRVVISSASGTEGGKVFYGLTDWMGSHDPMTHYDYAPDSYSGLMTDGWLTDTHIMLTVR